MSKISVCIISHNEENKIEKCLQSVKPIADEIIFVHDGECHDRTIEIAKKYGSKIFIRPYFGAMEGHLVFAIKQCSGDWVLRIDSDEFLSVDLQKNIKGLIEAKDIDAYSFSWEYFDNIKNKFLKNPGRKIILFRKEKLYWISIIHLAIQTRGKIMDTKYILGHDSLELTYKEKIKKYKKWAKIQARELLLDFSELENFQAERKDLEKTFVLSRRYAKVIFLPIFKFIFSFIKTYFHENRTAKEALFSAIYSFYLGWYLYKYSHKK